MKSEAPDYRQPMRSLITNLKITLLEVNGQRVLLNLSPQRSLTHLPIVLTLYRCARKHSFAAILIGMIVTDPIYPVIFNDCINSPAISKW
jgi:hypothetical protein